VSYVIQSDWATGFQAAIVIENTSTLAIQSWTLKLSFPGTQQITSSWGAGSSQSGELVALVNEGYNGQIAAGGSVSSIGFTANYNGRNAAPSLFSLNGHPCGAD
jgi:hypothetical protein